MSINYQPAVFRFVVRKVFFAESDHCVGFRIGELSALGTLLRPSFTSFLLNDGFQVIKHGIRLTSAIVVAPLTVVENLKEFNDY